MLTTALITAFKDRLSAKIPGGIPVYNYPDLPDTYTMRHATCELLVQYLGAKEEDGRRSMVGVVVVCKTNANARKYLEAVQAVLHGYHIPGCSRTQYVEDQLLGEENGLWRFAISFAVPNPVAPVTDANLQARFTALGL
jgi:hypothetical protein